MVNIWTEFRRHVLPWVLAGAVIGLMSHQENKRTARLNELLLRQAQSLEQVHILLSTQGYLVPPALPLSPGDELEFRGFESR